MGSVMEIALVLVRSEISLMTDAKLAENTNIRRFN